jgi:hypothetical protein
MLRRGRLRQRLGNELADRLSLVAESLPVVAEPQSTAAANRLVESNVDPGEAQLILVAVEQSALLLTHDKRALTAVAKIDELVATVAQRFVVVEAILLGLCQGLGREVVRSRVVPHAHLDRMFSICFGNASTDPCDGLRSYVSDLSSKVEPLRLWLPEETK